MPVRFLKRHNVKVAVIQESKLSPNSETPSIQNFTTVRKDCRQGQGGGLLTLIHKSINFSRKPGSPEILVEPHLEELTITATLGDTELVITNVYIPPASSCTGGYLPSLAHLMMTTDTLRLAPNDTAYKRWSCHSGFKLLCKLCRTSPPPAMGARFTVFWACRPCGPAGWLALLLTKAGDVETNPGPTTLNKKVWICDICHKQIHVRKQISIRCNRIEHWVHLRCAGIRQAQYTDTCHLHRESRLTPHTDITPPHRSRPLSNPPTHSPPQPKHRHMSNTPPIPTDIQHCIQYITNIPHSVLTGDVNAHSTLWHSYTDDHRGQLIADVISNSDHITLNTPTRVPNTTLQQTSSPDITTVSNTLYNRTSWTTQHALSSDHLPIITTINIRHDYNKTDGPLPTTRKQTGHNLQKTQSPLSLRPQYPPTYTLPT